MASNDPTAVATVASNVVAREGLPIPEDSESLAALQLPVLRAFVELHKGVIAQLQGEQGYRPTDESVARLVDANGNMTRTVKDLLDAYQDYKGEAWSPSAKSAFQPVCRILEDTLGERPAASITREDARDTLQLLRELPKGRSGSRPAMRGAPSPFIRSCSAWASLPSPLTSAVRDTLSCSLTRSPTIGASGAMASPMVHAATQGSTGYRHETRDAQLPANWQDRVRAAGLPGSAIAQELAGRSKRGSVSDSYGERSFPAQMLADAVAKIT